MDNVELAYGKRLLKGSNSFTFMPAANIHKHDYYTTIVYTFKMYLRLFMTLLYIALLAP